MMTKQYAYLEMFLQNIEDAIGNLKVKQIRFDFAVNDRGQTEVDLIAENEDGNIIVEEVALDTFAEAIKYLEEHIN